MLTVLFGILLSNLPRHKEINEMGDFWVQIATYMHQRLATPDSSFDQCR